MNENSFFVKLIGMEWNITVEEIDNFFNKSALNITLCVDSHNRPSGEAFVEFAHMNDYIDALKKHRKCVRSRYVEIHQSTKFEMENILWNDVSWKNGKNAISISSNESYKTETTNTNVCTDDNDDSSVKHVTKKVVGSSANDDFLTATTNSAVYDESNQCQHAKGITKPLDPIIDTNCLIEQIIPNVSIGEMDCYSMKCAPKKVVGSSINDDFLLERTDEYGSHVELAKIDDPHSKDARKTVVDSSANDDFLMERTNPAVCDESNRCQHSKDIINSVAPTINHHSTAEMCDVTPNVEKKIVEPFHSIMDYCAPTNSSISYSNSDQKNASGKAEKLKRRLEFSNLSRYELEPSIKRSRVWRTTSREPKVAR